MTLSLRNELLATSKRMFDLGLAPGTSGNVSVRTASGFFVTPSAIPYDQLQPDDMVGPCLFLASDASRMVTAQTLIVDGGYM